jgi:protein-S-isoprenylcysteine O-methyltransferase Ste14
MIIHARALELRIPPPVVAALAAGAMWGTSFATPLLEAPALIRVVSAGAIALAGAGFTLAGVVSFRGAKTTVNPLKPETASSLVRSGIYRLTRNPMYLGLVIVLVAWAVFLSSAWALLGPLIFVLYMNRFQIAPEERVLAELFGTSYSDYKAGVRRWL